MSEPVTPDSTLQASAFWDREAAAPTHQSWLADPRVRDYVNRLVGGAEPMWPLDWFARWLEGRRFRRALSIGCGTGALERDLIRRSLCDSVDAFDGSPHSIELARQAAAAEGMSARITYRVADFNAPDLPRNTYDLVLFHQSAHHVAKLERLYRAILGTITRDGLLYLDEYIGPSRDEWDDALIAPHRAWFDDLPAHVRRDDPLPLPIQPDDPSEAIRSSEIVPQLERGFDIVERRDYGGTLLSVVYPSINLGEAPEWLVPSMIEEEKRMMRDGSGSYHTIIVARPRTGLAGLLARARYWTEPKLRRIRYEILHRLRPEARLRF